VIDNLTGQTREINQHIGYSGDVFSMYTHCGTHIRYILKWTIDELGIDSFRASDV
jgi:hypothetical protein